MKTDIQENIGKHAFEVANLGLAPFSFVRYEKVNSSCCYCKTGILHGFWIRSADGKTFLVGSDCLMKTGNGGILKAYQASPEYRSAMRLKAKLRDEKVRAEWESIKDHPALKAHKVLRNNGTAQDWIDYASFALSWSGASGRSRYLKAAKQIISNA